MTAPSYKFAEFELDCARYELRRNGRTLKLERIPMELLILLAEKDGTVVTRQEIVDRVWGKDVFVDTEHGINTAIRKIRKALRDDPEQPRFVLTVTGKGYRFVRSVVEFEATHSGNGANGAGNGNGLAVSRGHELLLVDESVPKNGEDVDSAVVSVKETAAPLTGNLGQTASYGMWRHGIGITVGATVVILVVAALALRQANTHRLLGLRIVRYMQLTHDGLPKAQNPLLVNDGSRIYFSEETDSGFVIAQVPVNGGEVGRVPVSLHKNILGICDISPDRSEFLLSSWRGWWKEDALWVMPTTGGSARRLGSLSATFAAWSPEGNSIFYTTENGLYRGKRLEADSEYEGAWWVHSDFARWQDLAVSNIRVEFKHGALLGSIRRRFQSSHAVPRFRWTELLRHLESGRQILLLQSQRADLGIS